MGDQIESFLGNSEVYKLDQIETEVRELYRQFVNFRTNNADMLSQRNSAIEEKYVAYAASIQLKGSSSGRPSSHDPETHIITAMDQVGRSLLEEGSTVFSNIAGVILQQDQERFARTMFRATRGNAFTEFHNIPEPLRDSATGQEVLKSVFVVYYQGNRTSAMSSKITRICLSFNSSIYTWPKSEQEAIDQIQQADSMMEDKRAALMAYERFLTDESAYLYKLTRENGNSLVEEWKLFCAKEKAIYATLNLFEGDVTLRADCWFPADQESDIKGLLMVSNRTGEPSTKGQVSAMLLTSESQAAASSVPPTYIKENSVIHSFQLIVDTYGVPRYKEANPALLSIVTFPFLFGVMFGDVGHGLMLMMIGVWAIIQARQLENAKPSSGLKQLFNHRYMVTAMGFFAVYAGLLYSEFFAIGVNLFGSRWSCPDLGNGAKTVECIPLYDTSNSGAGSGPYPFGIDPAWDVASNQLLFVNSLKMKASVLFGVSQMLLGIFLKFSNCIYFRNYIDLIFECIPQLAFMLAFFAYMDFMIMYKWINPMAPGQAAPGLIDTMISMGLSGGGVREGAELYSGQTGVQTFLFKIGLWSVPLMLVPKPILLLIQHRLKGGRGHGSSNAVSEDRSSLIENSASGARQAEMQPKHDEHGFEFGEIAIHQAIETIEYVLGTVSHTASYLRLWALSLAHQQLSLVFLHKTIYAALSSEWPMILNAVPIYIGFALFIGVTTGILLGMDVMECFLHTLRLHWVEFQSKFYKADGIKFKPFSHKAVVEQVMTSAAPSEN